MDQNFFEMRPGEETWDYTDRIQREYEAGRIIHVDHLDHFYFDPAIRDTEDPNETAVEKFIKGGSTSPPWGRERGVPLQSEPEPAYTANGNILNEFDPVANAYTANGNMLSDLNSIPNAHTADGEMLSDLNSEPYDYYPNVLNNNNNNVTGPPAPLEHDAFGFDIHPQYGQDPLELAVEAAIGTYLDLDAQYNTRRFAGRTSLPPIPEDGPLNAPYDMPRFASPISMPPMPQYRPLDAPYDTRLFAEPTSMQPIPQSHPEAETFFDPMQMYGSDVNESKYQPAEVYGQDFAQASSSNLANGQNLQTQWVGSRGAMARGNNRPLSYGNQYGLNQRRYAVNKNRPAANQKRYADQKCMLEAERRMWPLPF
ncbi:MAG: hypothetical protein M1822_005741 [Bathelium mastoideum]|nr:MAG: hypothetical protein M1822_005741 [Bathelium mastoideum]